MLPYPTTVISVVTTKDWGSTVKGIVLVYGTDKKYRIFQKMDDCLQFLQDRVKGTLRRGSLVFLTGSTNLWIIECLGKDRRNDNFQIMAKGERIDWNGLLLVKAETAVGSLVTTLSKFKDGPVPPSNLPPIVQETLRIAQSISSFREWMQENFGIRDISGSRGSTACKCLEQCFKESINTGEIQGRIKSGVKTVTGPQDLDYFPRPFSFRNISPNWELEDCPEGLSVRDALYAQRNQRWWGEFRAGVGTIDHPAPSLNHYDIISMYPSLYDQPLPIGPLTVLHSLSWKRGDLGYAEVQSIPKDLAVGSLPTRDKSGHLCFPSGSGEENNCPLPFRGLWDMNELSYARSLGYQIRLIRQWESTDHQPILKGWGRKVGGLVEQYPDLRYMLKAYGILPIGKTVQHSFHTSYVSSSSIPREEWPDRNVRILDQDGAFLEVETEGRPSRYSRPMLGIRIWALARILHHRYLQLAVERGGLGGLYYCDTDSIFTTADLSDLVGTAPGGLKLVQVLGRAVFFNLKKYWIRPLDKNQNPKTVWAGYNGKQLTEEEIDAVLEGAVDSFRNKEPTFPKTEGVLRGEEISGQFRIISIKEDELEYEWGKV